MFTPAEPSLLTGSQATGILGACRVTSQGSLRADSTPRVRSCGCLALPSPSFQATLVGPVCTSSQDRGHPRVPQKFPELPLALGPPPCHPPPCFCCTWRRRRREVRQVSPRAQAAASASPSEVGGHGWAWTGWGGPCRSPALGSEDLCPSAASVCMCTYVFVTFLWICFCVSVNQSPNIKARWQGAVTCPHPWGRQGSQLLKP